MSYSRWGGRGSGNWYTFWHSQDDETENRDTAIFCICCVYNFTAKDIRDDIDKCLDIVKGKDPDGDLNELKRYMLEFLKDVDDMYPKS